MTIVQEILHKLNRNIEINQEIECFETRNMNNGYYKLWLVDGKYSYVTDENFQRLQPYITYKEKEYINPTQKLLNNLSLYISQFEMNLEGENYC